MYEGLPQLPKILERGNCTKFNALIATLIKNQISVQSFTNPNYGNLRTLMIDGEPSLL